MIKFANPEYLYFFVIIPLLAVFYIFTNFLRRKRIQKYGDVELIAQLMPDVSQYRPNLKFWLTLAALSLLIFAVARPQFGSKMEKITRSGIEVVIALDISNSMLADDVAPNRLEKSKKMISKLLDDFENDKVGLIIFAGDAFIQVPITNDFISAKMFLESISPDLIARQGTDIGSAISLAMKSFTPNEKVGKAIVVITDGENHEGGAEEAAKAAAAKGMTVYVLGVGSPEGSPIPLNQLSNDYHKDNQGNIIVSRLNEQMCQDIAKAGNGAYIRVDNSNNAQKLLEKEMNKLAKTDVESEIYTEFDEQYQIIAAIAFILLFIEMLIFVRKTRLTRNFKLFS